MLSCLVVYFSTYLSKYRRSDAHVVNSEVFARILFSQKELKAIFATLKITRLGHDLPTSVNDRVILPFCEGFFYSEVSRIFNPHKHFRIYSI